MKNRTFFIGLLLILLASASYGQNVVIINSAHPAKAVTSSDLTNIFLGKSSTLAGEKVVPVDEKRTTEAGKAFLDKILKMSESDYQSRWVEKMLSGEASPPAVKASDAEVLSFVKSTPGAIGYVSASADLSGVTVLPVDGNQQW